MDNCAAQSTIPLMFSPNRTSAVQSRDIGMFTAFMGLYRLRLLKKTLAIPPQPDYANTGLKEW